MNRTSKRVNRLLAWMLTFVMTGMVLFGFLPNTYYASEASNTMIQEESLSYDSISEDELSEHAKEEENEAELTTNNNILTVDFANGSSNLFTASEGTSNGDPYNCGWYANNCVFQNDEMQLVIDRDSRGMYTYSAGQYRSNGFYGYGTYEVAMKPIKNDGVVSTFCIYTGTEDENPWDEIDIEFLGKDTTKVQFNYYGNSTGNHQYMYDLGFDASEEYHFYGFRWEEGKITWLVDGTEVYVATSSIPTNAGRIIMNAWPGTGVDDWLNPFDDNTPITSHYRMVHFVPEENSESSKPLILLVSQPSAITTVSSGSISGNLSASALVSNGTTPSYEWFQCDNEQRENPVRVGTGSEFTIPTALTKGTYFYYCRVSTTDADNVDSKIAKIVVQGSPSTVSPPSITTESLAEGIVNTIYTQALDAAGGKPVIWSIVSGNLPEGLTLSGNVIRGIPAKAETANFTVRAENAGGADSKSMTIRIKELPVKNGTITIKPIPNQYYNGKALTPEPEIYDGDIRLTNQKDYTLQYQNNCEAGTGLVIMTGKGEYAGKIQTITFQIDPKKMSDEDIIVDDIYLAVTGKVQKPLPKVFHGTKKLKYKSNTDEGDYTVSYAEGDYKTAEEYIITITGSKNYCGIKACRLVLCNKTMLNKAKIICTANMKYDKGNAVVPKKLTVKYGKKVLKRDIDYTVSYRNNHEIGTATAVIKGMRDYAGIRYANYKIKGIHLSKAKVSGVKKKTYTEEPVFQIDPYNPSVSTCKVTYRGETLLLHKDFEVAYRKNTVAGKAAMILTGKGAYYGTVKKSFSILPYDIRKNRSGSFRMDDSVISVPLENGVAKPKVKVYFNQRLLQEKVDYSLSYRNNKKVNDGTNRKKVPEIMIKGKGNFVGKISKSFVITP